MKFRRVLERRTRGCDQHRGLALLSPSLRILVALSILAVLVGTAPKLGAQSVTSGDIAGLVTDPSGAVLTNASVTLKSQENGSTQVQSTNSRGVYRFSLVPPGRYSLSVAVSGFQQGKATAVVTIGQATTVNIALALGEANSTIEVTSGAPLLQTENADLSTSFSETQISQTPNPGNDLSYIAQAAPGVWPESPNANLCFAP